MKKAAALLLALFMIIPFVPASAGTARSYAFPVPLWNAGRVRKFVEKCYQEILDRDADEDELKGWINAVRSGETSLENVIHFFMTSEEIEKRNLSHADFVRLLYSIYLGREPDAEGFAAWTALLDGGANPEDLLEDFSTSDEFLNVRNKLGTGMWEETELYKSVYLSKKNAAPASYMTSEESQARMAAILFLEANRGISETLDSNFERKVYTGLDKDDFGFAAFPLYRNGGYRAYCWQGSLIMDWGTFTDDQIPALLKMMKETHGIDIFDFQDVMDSVRAEYFQ